MVEDFLKSGIGPKKVVFHMLFQGADTSGLLQVGGEDEKGQNTGWSGCPALSHTVTHRWDESLGEPDLKYSPTSLNILSITMKHRTIHVRR